MKGTPAMSAYHRAISALADHLQSDEVGWELFCNYEEAVIGRVELAIRLGHQKPVLPRAFGGLELTVIEKEFDHRWKLVRAILGVDHLQDANDLLDAALACVSEAYDVGMRRGIGQLANPGSTGKINPTEMLGELAQATAAIARHLQDLGTRV
jgi:hypothetical protein